MDSSLAHSRSHSASSSVRRHSHTPSSDAVHLPLLGASSSSSSATDVDRDLEKGGFTATAATAAPALSLPGTAAAKSSSRHRLVQLAYIVAVVVVVHTLVDLLFSSSAPSRSRSVGDYFGRGGPFKSQQSTGTFNPSAALDSLPAAFGFDGQALRSDVYPSISNVCDICDCSTSPPSLSSSSFKSRDRSSRADLPGLVRNAVLDIQCHGVYSTHTKSLVSLRDLLKDPSSTVQWNLTGLDLNKPTSFMFTKTVPTSVSSERNVHDNAERSGYMHRHVETIHKFHKKLQGEWKGKYEDGTLAQDRQILWIIVEDDHVIDPLLAATLAEGRISYIYFAFGPTRNFGNAQHNAALAMIHHLSNEETGLLGHGPIFSADDDAEIHEDLLMYIWRLRRIGVWPMGNLGPTGFEAPIWGDDNKIKSWSAGNSWRKYPLDNGAFAFNSTLLGHDLPGPRFWPTDTNGGETEFIEKLVKDKSELEPVCKDCHVAWHNHPLNIPHVGNNTYRPG